MLLKTIKKGRNGSYCICGSIRWPQSSALDLRSINRLSHFSLANAYECPMHFGILLGALGDKTRMKHGPCPQRPWGLKENVVLRNEMRYVFLFDWNSVEKKNLLFLFNRLFSFSQDLFSSLPWKFRWLSNYTIHTFWASLFLFLDAFIYVLT
jgi:hypothetical protein